MHNKRHSIIKKKDSGLPEVPSEHKEINILIDRFAEYKSIIKGFIAYYEDIAKLENFVAAELQKIGAHLPFPLREGNQFLAKGGWQTILCNTRELTRLISDHHTTFAQSIHQSTVSNLHQIKNHIKKFTTELEAKPAQLATDVGKSRTESTRAITQLSQAIIQSRSNPAALVSHDDPVLLHRQVERQLREHLNLENSLTRTIIEYQKKAFELEKRVNTDFQTIADEFESARASKAKKESKEWKTIHAGVIGLSPDLEWNEFSHRSGHLIPGDIPLRDVDKLNFPGHNEDITVAVNVGILERKKRFTRHYKEGYYVLTPSGYLHEFKSSDPEKHQEPEMSIYLPNCTLGAPAAAEAKRFKWHVEGGKDTSGGHNPGSLNKLKKSLHIGSNEISFSFKCRTHAEMIRWWEAMQQVARSSVTHADQNPIQSQEHIKQTVTRRESSPQDEESGGSSAESDSVFSPNELSTAPTTPAVLTHFKTEAYSPTKTSSENLPQHKSEKEKALAEKPSFSSLEKK